MANMVQTPDGAVDFEGHDHIKAGFVPVSMEWDASSVDKVFFVAPRRMIVKAITARVTTAGTDGSDVEAEIVKVDDGDAIGNGTAVHSGVINLKGTANTNQVLTLASDPATLVVEKGQALAINFTGTLTAATGVVTVSLAPA